MNRTDFTFMKQTYNFKLIEELLFLSIESGERI